MNQDHSRSSHKNKKAEKSRKPSMEELDNVKW